MSKCHLLADLVCALTGNLSLLSPNSAALHDNRDHRNDQDDQEQKQLAVTVLAHVALSEIGPILNAGAAGVG
jgi:hypothetical protein